MAGMVRIICPNLKCRAILTTPDAARGKSVRCKVCGSRVFVPLHVPKPKPKTEILDESADTAEDAAKSKA